MERFTLPNLTKISALDQDAPKWLSVLENVKDYPSSSLLSEYQEIDDKKPRLDPLWINDNPDTSLKDLGLSDYEKLKDFIIDHGTELKCLNLNGHKIDNDQFKQLIKSCPNLTQLSLSSPPIEYFEGCENLTDKALEHLKGMPLTSVTFSYCYKLTDKALEHLKGMPLTNVDFSGCYKLYGQGPRAA